MIKIKLLPIFVLVATVLTGCAIFTGNKRGDAAKIEEKSRTKVINLEDRISSNLDAQIDTIATLSFGVDYALNKVEEPPREVTVAKDINKRVMSLSGTPSIEKMKEMQATIDNLTSQLNTERKEGERKLNEKDLAITKLQDEAKLLKEGRELEIKKYMAAAQEAAKLADDYKAELNKMDAWMGLGAVVYGLKQFVVKSMWILGIGSILFIVLRVASMSNPIAASVFSIFNIIGSWIAGLIKMLFPKAIELAGYTSTKVYDSYNKTLYKIVDGIQSIRDKQKILNESGKKYSIDDLLKEFSSLLSDDDKERIYKIKSEMGYK